MCRPGRLVGGGRVGTACVRLDEPPGLDALADDEPGRDVRIVSRERLDVALVDVLEDDRAGVRGVAEGTGKSDVPGLLFGLDPGEVSLPVGPAALGHVLDVLVEEDVVGGCFRHGA